MKIEEFKKLVIKARKAQGLSQKELAELADVGETVIYKIESGRKDVTLSNFLIVLSSLGIEMICRSPLGEETRLER